MTNVKSVLLVGVGGQGTILMSKVLTRGLIAAGYDVKMSEVHGMAQRGGSVSTQVRYGEKVHSPLFGQGAADVLAAVEEKLGIKTGSITEDGKFSLDACRCIGACGLAPVMMINDDVYGRLTPAQVGPILDQYIAKG